MLQKLGDQIANCLARAADAERRAAEAPNETMRADNEEIARGWRQLARSYQVVDSLECFLLVAERLKGAEPPDAPSDAKSSARGRLRSGRHRRR